MAKLLAFTAASKSYCVNTSILACRSFYLTASSKNTNLYDTLCINPGSTQAEIKKAYYDLTLKYHPDRNEGCEEAAKKFREVTEAYEVLGNYILRRRYDRGIPLLPVVKPVTKESVALHDVKYQKFFDSRMTKTGADTKFEKRRPQFFQYPEPPKIQDLFVDIPPTTRPTKGVVFTIGCFFVSLSMYAKYYIE